MTNGGLYGLKWLLVSLPNPNLIVDLRRLKSKKFDPFRYASGRSVYLDVDIATRIAHLLFWCSPSAVAWLVITIAVYSVYGVGLARLFSHISKKVLKTVFPSIANNDSSTPIDWVLFIVRVVASPLHKLPCSVFYRASRVVSSLVRVASLGLTNNLSDKASAAKRGSAYVGSGGYGLVTAVALALPHGVIGSRNLNALQHRQSTELLPLNLSHCLSLCAI